MNASVGSVTKLCSFEGIVCWGCYGNKSAVPLGEASGTIVKRLFLGGIRCLEIAYVEGMSQALLYNFVH